MCGRLLNERSSQCGMAGSKTDEHLRRLVHSFIQVGTQIMRHSCVLQCQQSPAWQQQSPRILRRGLSMRRRHVTTGGGRTRGWCARWSRSCLSAMVTRPAQRRPSTCRDACWCACRRSLHSTSMDPARHSLSMPSSERCPIVPTPCVRLRGQHAAVHQGPTHHYKLSASFAGAKSILRRCRLRPEPDPDPDPKSHR